MRPDQGNPLDLNNFPEDFTRDGKQLADQDSSSSSGYRRKKNSSSKDGKDDSGKVYECRFCSLKFCKSQALGGHMNRHRQERETENLNRARQLVYSNDNLAPRPPHHLGGQTIPNGGYHPQAGGDLSFPFRPIYPTTRLFPGSSSTLLPTPPPPQHPSYLYPSSPSLLHSYPSPYSTNNNDYFVGHVLSGNNSPYNHSFPSERNYTCIGAPVEQPFPPTVGSSVGGGQVTSDVEAASGGDGGGGGGRSYLRTSQHNLDPPTSINRFHDGY